MEVTKKVSMFELFYDLVFVYAISCMTKLIYHLNHGVIEPVTFLVFIFVLITLINAWMYQAVYNNRYYKDNQSNILFLMMDMAFVLILANSVGENFVNTWTWGCGALSFLSLSLSIQYRLQLTDDKSKNEKKVIKIFSVILLIKTLIILFAVLFPFNIGFTIMIIGVILGFLLPVPFLRTMESVPINFPLLAERISLLIIITFGEMIVGLVSYFEISSLSLMSAFIFITAVSLFVYYKLQFEDIMNHNQVNNSGGRLIYSHYFAFIGLSLFTVSFAFLTYTGSNMLFVVALIYVSMFLFYLTSIINQIYNKEVFQNTKKIKYNSSFNLVNRYYFKFIFISMASNYCRYWSSCYFCFCYRTIYIQNETTKFTSLYGLT